MEHSKAINSHNTSKFPVLTQWTQLRTWSSSLWSSSSKHKPSSRQVQLSRRSFLPILSLKSLPVSKILTSVSSHRTLVHLLFPLHFVGMTCLVVTRSADFSLAISAMAALVGYLAGTSLITAHLEAWLEVSSLLLRNQQLQIPLQLKWRLQISDWLVMMIARYSVQLTSRVTINNNHLKINSTSSTSSKRDRTSPIWASKEYWRITGKRSLSQNWWKILRQRNLLCTKIADSSLQFKKRTSLITRLAIEEAHHQRRGLPGSPKTSAKSSRSRQLCIT